MYADRLYGLRKEYHGSRDMFNNRKHIYASENPMFGKEAPAGFVGLQNMYRIYPHLNPTQELPTGGPAPSKNDETIWTDPRNTDLVKSLVATRKPHVSECDNPIRTEISTTA